MKNVFLERQCINICYRNEHGGRCGRDRMVDGYITTHAISAYQH